MRSVAFGFCPSPVRGPIQSGFEVHRHRVPTTYGGHAPECATYLEGSWIKFSLFCCLNFRIALDTLPFGLQ